MKRVEILGLTTIPEIEPGDRLAEIIAGCAKDEVGGIQERDIIVVTSKIVSKAEGNIVTLAEVRPGKRALALSRKTGKAASRIQVILDDGQEIVAAMPLIGFAEKYIMRSTQRPDEARQSLDRVACILVTRDRDGRLHTSEGGTDTSNHPEGVVSLCPPDPDKSAWALRQEMKRLTGRDVAVLIADTEIVPFGSLDIAIGSSGIQPVSKRFGENDRFGKPKFGGMDIIAYELTAAAALLFGQADEGVPVAIVRGFDYRASEEENILNTLVPDWQEVRRTLKSVLRTTASLGSPRNRILFWALRLFAKV